VKRCRRVGLVSAGGLLLSLSFLSAFLPAIAQDFDHAMFAADEGEEATLDEMQAFRAFQMEQYVRARELAQRIVRDHPDSIVGHFVLGLVHHYAEANFPKAIYHLELALSSFERQHGPEPLPPAPWKWHMRLLRELSFAHGDLENHEEKIAYLARHNEIYDPDLVGEAAWPLMKLGRFDEARAIAEQALETGRPQQTLVGLNALCAIEFEAGNDGASYEACKTALDYGKLQPEGATAVDYTNFSEAARSVFKLEEAERAGLEATQAPVSWYGSPWLELAELYVREGRYAEALSALHSVPAYRMERPPHVRDSDRNEWRRALSSFYLVVGRPEEALAITEKAMVSPDRRAHQSRDPNQDLALTALLDRRSRLMVAELRDEEAAARPFYENYGRFFDGLWSRFSAWTSGRRAATALADDERLVGTFRIGTSKSGILPPWLAGELVEVLGPGVVEEAVREAREDDDREGSDAYYDAFEAECKLVSGDEEEALELAERAIASLSPAEALLRARLFAIAAQASRELEDEDLSYYETALQIDPGVFRRFGWSVPVQIAVEGDEVAEAVEDAIESSPRFDVGDRGPIVRIDATAAGGTVCLADSGGNQLSCAEEQPKPDESPDEFAVRLADAFHREAFAPRIDLSQADIGSLDGSNQRGHWDEDLAPPEEIP
jgi:tetratricopeptide (TPR) repeat protein